MLTLYWICLSIGGVFVLLAVLGGLDGLGFDHDFDHDFDHGVEIDHDLEDVDVADPGDRPPANSLRTLFDWLGIFRSLKFWTFGVCFFGVTGVVLSTLFNLPPALVTIAAAIVGLLCGLFVAGLLRLLRRRQVDSLVRSADLVGLTGIVQVPFTPDSRGKVRLLVKGTMVDLIAYTDEKTEFNPGDLILVVGMDQDRLWVVKSNEDGKNTDA